MIVAVPSATGVTEPEDETVAIDASDEDQDTLTPLMVAPFWSLTVAESWVVAASEAKVSWDSDNSMLVATGVGVGVNVPELGPVVLSPPPQAINNKATPANRLYRYISRSHD